MTDTRTAPATALRPEGSGHAVAVVTSDGTAWSWADIDHEFTPALIAYARSRGITADEDVAQDVLLAAVEKLESFQGSDEGLRSWLFTIAFRRIADQHRRRYRHGEVLVADQSPRPNRAGSVEDRIVDHDDVGAVMAALAELSGRERTVLERRILDEASVADVARQLGIRQGHVRVIQSRALTKVRRRLHLLDHAPALSLAAVILRPESLIGDLRELVAPAGASPAAFGAATGAGLVLKLGAVATLMAGSAGVGQVVVTSATAPTTTTSPSTTSDLGTDLVVEAGPGATALVGVTDAGDDEPPAGEMPGSPVVSSLLPPDSTPGQDSADSVEPDLSSNDVSLLQPDPTFDVDPANTVGALDELELPDVGDPDLPVPTMPIDLTGAVEPLLPIPSLPALDEALDDTVGGLTDVPPSVASTVDVPTIAEVPSAANPELDEPAPQLPEPDDVAPVDPVPVAEASDSVDVCTGESAPTISCPELLETSIVSTG